MGARVSLVVCTLNEEGHIAACIESARELVDEVVVVDMESEDRTQEIARAQGAAIHRVERRPFVDPIRNAAIAKASGDWVLLLDADERLSPELVSELRAIAEDDKADVVSVPLDTYMFGRRIRYSGWQDGRKNRFFKKGFLEYPDVEMHAHPVIRGRHLVLPAGRGSIRHFNYRDLAHFVAKLNSYTDGEALKLARSGGKPSPLRGVYWGVRHFLRRFLLLRGYRDGADGFMLSALMGFYWFLAACKAWELARERRRGADEAGR